MSIVAIKTHGWTQFDRYIEMALDGRYLIDVDSVIPSNNKEARPYRTPYNVLWDSWNRNRVNRFSSFATRREVIEHTLSSREDAALWMHWHVLADKGASLLFSNAKILTRYEQLTFAAAMRWPWLTTDWKEWQDSLAYAPAYDMLSACFMAALESQRH